ncbi:MAG: glycosyltransferase family 2 protein [Deltaproteobacteria bacterium]|nr:glycosyltransferase family 2 protein [Deltaproteobacteria bacterium]
MRRGYLLEAVICVHNETSNLPELIHRLERVFATTGSWRQSIDRVLVTFVDDGSRDSLSECTRELATQSPLEMRIVRLSRQFGHQAAISAGLKQSRGDRVLLMDGDLQDPPEVVPTLLNAMDQGHDVVYGIRRNRKEVFWRRLGYWAFYRFSQRIGAPLPLDAGDFAVLSRRVVNQLTSLGGVIRFNREERSWLGFRQTGIPYDRGNRHQGVSKYSLFSLIQLALDGITSSSIKPLWLPALLCLIYGVASVGLGLCFLGTTSPQTQHFLLTLVFISLNQVFVLAALSVMGVYIGKTYLEAQRRPPFIVEEVLSFPRPRPSLETQLRDALAVVLDSKVTHPPSAPTLAVDGQHPVRTLK